MVEYKGTITKDDFIRAQYLVMRPRPIFAIIGIGLAALFIWVVVEAPSPLSIGLLTFFPFYFLLLIPFLAIRAFNNYPSIREEFSMRLADEGLEFETRDSRSLLRWGRIINSKSNRGMLLLYLAPNTFHIIPSRMFESDKAFRDFKKTVDIRIEQAGSK